MIPERFRQIEELYHAAREKSAEERAALLAEADPEVRREVESLLAQPGGEFLDRPAIQNVSQLLEDSTAAVLTAGACLGPYRIEGKLGEGGMGEVYRAVDTRLGRAVAIKTTRERFSARFEREARAISSLNHPNICTLYDVGPNYLVMELVEGETIAARLKSGRLPVETVLLFASQIAAALAEAHAKGIVHRDLKPGNIMIAKSGIKVLDFGLAKLDQGAASANGQLSQVARSEPLTAQGSIVGTIQYMAPEQLEGKKTDARADIFAFGAIMYEMVTGKKAFEGTSQAILIARILESDPTPISALQPMTPPVLDRVVQKCLAKEPEKRWQDTSDLCDELKWIAEGGSQSGASAPAPAHQNTKKRIVWITAAIAILAVFAAIFHFRKPPAEPRVVRFAVALPEKLVFPPLGLGSSLSVSPDGSKLAFSTEDAAGHSLLWIRDLDSQAVQPLPGTDGATTPFWSPDSRSIAFTAGSSLNKVPISGGPAETITRLSGYGMGTWNRDGVILFAPNLTSPVLRVSSAGGSAAPATSLDLFRHQIGHAFPSFLPDGQHFLYSVITANLENAGIYIGSLDSKASKLLLKATSMALYSPPGYLLFVRVGTLFAQPFDAERLELKGDAVPVAEGVQSGVGGRAAFAVSQNGVLAYQSSLGNARYKLVWVDRKGVEQPLTSPAHIYRDPRLSPDGKQVAVTIDELGSQEWLLNIGRGSLALLTFEGSYNGGTAWTPDGKRITFGSDRAGARNLFWQLADGSGGAQRLTTSEITQVAGSWSPDGQTLAFEQSGPDTGFDIWTFRLGERKAEPFLHSRFNEVAPRFSPDGRYLAYASDESGRYEIYVQPYPGPGGKLQISTEGGTQPVWARNGELFYRNGEKVMVVETATRPAFSASNPKELFEGRYASYRTLPDYDVTADGQRFLFLKAGEEAQPEINVVVNWPEELKRNAPAGEQ